MRDLINLIQILSEAAVGMSAKEIIGREGRFEKFIEYIKGKKTFTTVDGEPVTIDPREAKRFIELRNQDMFTGTLKARTTDGQEIPLSKLAKTKDFGGAAPAYDEEASEAGKEALVVKPSQIGICDKSIPAEEFYNVIANNKILASTDYGQVIQSLAEYIVAGEYVMLPDEYKGKAKEKVRKAIVDYAGEYLGVLALLYQRSRFPKRAQFEQWLGAEIGDLTLFFPSKANTNLADSFAQISNPTTSHNINISSKGTGGGAAPALSGLVIPEHIKQNPKFNAVVQMVDICRNDTVLMSIFNLMDLVYSVNPKTISKKYHKFLPFSRRAPDLPALCKASVDAKSKTLAQPVIPEKYKPLLEGITGGGTDGGKILYGIRKEVGDAINHKDGIPEFKTAILEILEMNFIQQYCDYKNGELTFATQWPAKLDGDITMENKASTKDPLSNGFSFKLGRTDDSVSSEPGEEPVDGLEDEDFTSAAADITGGPSISEPKSKPKSKSVEPSVGNVGRKKR